MNISRPQDSSERSWPEPLITFAEGKSDKRFLFFGYKYLIVI